MRHESVGEQIVELVLYGQAADLGTAQFQQIMPRIVVVQRMYPAASESEPA